MSAVVTSSLLPDEKPVRQREESNLQRAVHRFLSIALPPHALHFAVPNGLMRSKKARAQAQGEGVCAGIPDLCVVFRGRVYFIELKRPKGGALSAAQRRMHRRLEYCDASVMVCRSVSEVELQLRECCIPLRATCT